MFVMMKYIRAEREADWPLHLAAVAEMMPYFFASGHFNYARYIFIIMTFSTIFLLLIMDCFTLLNTTYINIISSGPRFCMEWCVACHILL